MTKNLIIANLFLLFILLATSGVNAFWHGVGTSGNFLTDAGGSNILLDGGVGFLVAS